MAVDYKVSMRYASSLLDSAIERKNLDTIFNDMELISSTIEGSNQLQLVLQNPVVKSKVKSSILNELFQNKVDKNSLEFINFVVEKGREDLLLSIVKKFLELRDEHEGIVNVVVTTAFDFSEDQKELLKQNLEQKINKKVRLKFKLDPNIIGGFIARVSDTVYDASVKHQLELLKKQFMQGGASLN